MQLPKFKLNTFYSDIYIKPVTKIILQILLSLKGILGTYYKNVNIHQSFSFKALEISWRSFVPESCYIDIKILIYSIFHQYCHEEIFYLENYIASEIPQDMNTPFVMHWRNIEVACNHSTKRLN